jgi:hypothetical protein
MRVNRFQTLPSKQNEYMSYILISVAMIEIKD